MFYVDSTAEDVANFFNDSKGITGHAPYWVAHDASPSGYAGDWKNGVAAPKGFPPPQVSTQKPAAMPTANAQPPIVMAMANAAPIAAASGNAMPTANAMPSASARKRHASRKTLLHSPTKMIRG